ncbi:MAG: hypothetical protein R2862_11375 [Thermoanaerobaculia bacterium]
MQSPALLGIVGFAGRVPALVASPSAGWWPTASRRSVLLATQTASMLLAFVLAALTLGGRISVPRSSRSPRSPDW